MSAVISSPIATPIRHADDDIRAHGLDRSALEYQLEAWGKWIEDHPQTGYSPLNAIEAFLNGGGGGVPGHRVLCSDPPRWWWRTDVMISYLNEQERAAIRIEYEFRMREDGTLWSQKEKLEYLGIPVHTYRAVLSRARGRLLGLR